MLFGPVRDRPHEDRRLPPGHSAASILIAFQARPEVDVDAVVTELEDIVRELLDDWYDNRGHKLLEAAPDLA